jgi:hypothetical protein
MLCIFVHMCYDKLTEDDSLVVNDDDKMCRCLGRGIRYSLYKRQKALI